MDLREADALEAAVRAGLLDVHTSMPGRVVSYSEATHRAVVEPCSRRALLSDKGGISVESLPKISNVLVVWPGSDSGGGIRFALAAGDSVWLHFSETDSAGWEKTGSPSNPRDASRHTLGHPVAYPFPRTGGGSSDGNVFGVQLVVGSKASAMAVVQAPKLDADLAALQAMLLLLVNAIATDGAGPLVTAPATVSAATTLAGSLATWPNPLGRATAKLKAE